MKFPITGLAWLLLFAVVFCATHPYHAVTRLEMPQPAVSVTNR